MMPPFDDDELFREFATRPPAADELADLEGPWSDEDEFGLPATPEFKAELLRQTIDRAADERSRRRRLRLISGTVTGLALAAGIVMWLLTRSPSPNYVAEWVVPPTSHGAPLELALIPEQAYAGKVDVALYVDRRHADTRLTATPHIAPEGEVRLPGELGGAGWTLPAGTHTVLVEVTTTSWRGSSVQALELGVDVPMPPVVASLTVTPGDAEARVRASQSPTTAPTVYPGDKLSIEIAPSHRPGVSVDVRAEIKLPNGTVQTSPLSAVASSAGVLQVEGVLGETPWQLGPGLHQVRLVVNPSDSPDDKVYSEISIQVDDVD